MLHFYLQLTGYLITLFHPNKKAPGNTILLYSWKVESRKSGMFPCSLHADMSCLWRPGLAFYHSTRQLTSVGHVWAPKGRVPGIDSQEIWMWSCLSHQVSLLSSPGTSYLTIQKSEQVGINALQSLIQLLQIHNRFVTWEIEVIAPPPIKIKGTSPLSAGHLMGSLSGDSSWSPGSLDPAPDVPLINFLFQGRKRKERERTGRETFGKLP